MSVLEEPVTLVPLKISEQPSKTSEPISYDGVPPPGWNSSDLVEVNELAHILLQAPEEFVFPPIPQLSQNVRSAKIAKAKEDGNIHFRKGEWVDAIRLYTLSAEIAASRPIFEANLYARDELALVLSNRSAAYASAGDWVNSLIDAESVIQLKRPWVKGHFRKGKALAGMGRFAEAREALLLGLQFDPNAEDLQQAANDIDRQMQESTLHSTTQ